MAPNATASEPTKAAKKPSRQPPSDSVWVRYHPWMEGAMGHIASWSIHLLILGVAILVSLAYAWGFIKQNHQLPVEPVQFADAGGGGSPEGSGDGPGGDHAPAKEGVTSDKPNDGNTTNPTADRVQLTEVQAQRVAQEFPAEDARRIQQGPESVKAFTDLDKEFRDKLRDGINPSKGNGGTGKDGGTGSGKDKGIGSGTGEGTGRMLNEREKRMLRWSMKFNTRTGLDYLQQLDALGAILAIPDGPGGQFKVIRELSRRPPQLLDEDLSKIQRIWWIDDNPRSVESLMTAMGLPLRPSRVVAFIPPELEDDLAQKELAFKGLKEDQIYETKFDVYPAGGAKRYDVRVIGQQAK